MPNYIRDLKSQVQCQELDITRTLEGYAQSRREQDLLHEELADRERVLRETHITGIHEMEALKRVQELRVDQFSRRRMIEDQDTISELTRVVATLFIAHA